MKELEFDKMHKERAETLKNPRNNNTDMQLFQVIKKDREQAPSESRWEEAKTIHSTTPLQKPSRALLEEMMLF